MDMVFLQNGRIFPGVHKIGAAISGPRIADKHFTDTRIFLSFSISEAQLGEPFLEMQFFHNLPAFNFEFIFLKAST